MLNCAFAAELTVNDGVVVKFGTDSELVSRNTLKTQGEVIFTSINDGSVGGATIANAPLPQAGDWIGLTLTTGASVSGTVLNNVEIRYAGGGNGAALAFSRLPYVFEGVTLRDNAYGIKVIGSDTTSGVPIIRDSVLINNQIGLQSEGATPRIENSELANNSNFAVLNLTPSQIVSARQNWWGHPSGPRDPVANLNGQGSAVSPGVDYGQFLASTPLGSCSVRAANGVYAVNRRQVILALRCRNASSFRLSESTTFAGGFTPISASTNFVLSAGAGNKTVYAEFRGNMNQARVVLTPQPFVLTPSTPTITFQAPAANAVLTTNTVIRITAADPIGVASVEFKANDQVLGVDQEAPYEWTWDISAIPDGAYTLKALATNTDETSAIATQQVRVIRTNPQPDTYSSREGEVLFVDPPGILANDQAGNGSGITIEIAQQPAWGTLTMTGNGGFVFQPDSADRNGTTTFSYRLRTSGQTSNPILVTLNITAVNDAPDADDDSYLTDENVELVVPVPGVLSNDEDIDSTGLTALLLTSTTHGLLTFRSNGSFNYVPEVNYRGLDGFTYRLQDPEGATHTGEVVIAVSQPPTATNDVYLLDVNQFLEVTDVEDGLLDNDFDFPEDDSLTAEVITPPANGVLQLLSNGTFTYQPNVSFQGLDPFSYRVSDGRSNSNAATVTLAVGITNLPRANADAYEGLEDQELVVNAANGLLANDTDQDTPANLLEAFLVHSNDREQVVVNRDGSFSVKTMRNFNGFTEFSYEIFDGTSRSNVAKVVLDFALVNDGVDAVDDIYGVRQNEILVANGGSSRLIGSNDLFDDDFAVTYVLVTPPQFGVSTITPSGVLTYAPAQGFSGSDQLTYRVSQVGTSQSDTAVVRVRTNAPPVARPDAYTIDEDSVSVVTPSLLVNDSDPDNDPLKFIDFTAGARYGRVDWNSLTNPTVFRASSRAHFYGVETFSYRITDEIYFADAQITLTVRPVPDAPRAASDNYLTQRNTTLTIDSVVNSILKNDFDPDLREFASASPWAAATGIDLVPFTMQLLATTQNGQLTLNPNGTFIYAPNQNYSGLDTFRYLLTDATGRVSEPAIVSIRVNTAPIAGNDAYTVNEDTQLTVSAANGILLNDSDIDGDTLVSNATGGSPCSPCQGQVSIRIDGGFTYKAAPNYFGPDRFFYRASDPYFAFGLGAVNVTVLPVNDAPITEPDSYRVDEDNPLVAPTALGVLRNDEEVDGETLGNAIVTRQPTNGAIILQSSGGFAYTPNSNWSGRETLRYRVYDQSGLFAEDEIVIFVDSVNDAPTALPDSYSAIQNQTLNVARAQGVLVNDTDIDSTALTAAQLSTTANGLLTLRPDGSFKYQPNGVFAGVDQFEYQVSDDRGAVATARVSITVSDVTDPIEITVADDQYVVNGPNLTVPAPGVLVNDGATGTNAALSTALLNQPIHGSVQLASNGGFVYTAPANFVGSTSFAYTASVAGQSAIGLVSLQISNSMANLVPIAQSEQFGMFEDNELDSASVGSVLANDRDPEGQALAAVLVNTTSRGVLTLQNNGHFLYRPHANANGSDQFQYRVSDGVNSSGIVTASISILAQNDPPIAQDDNYQGSPNQPLNIAVAAGVLTNDSDIDADSLTVELVDEPNYGQLIMSANGSFVYQPTIDFVGTDQFRYAVTDGQARDLAVVNVRITGTANRPPVATGESYSLTEDSVLRSGGAIKGLLVNDSDPDGDSLSVQILTQPADGSLVIDGAHFRYTPNANYFGADQFTYKVTDGALSSNTVSTLLTVTGVNDAPIAVVDRYLMTQATVLTLSSGQGVLANDRDVENQPLIASVHALPAHGTLQLQSSGAFVYTPQSNFTGRDEFSYRVSDGSSDAIGRVAIDITALSNQRPLAVGESFVIPEDSILDTTSLESLLANDRDPEGQPLTLRITEQPIRGTLTALASGHIRYQPVRNDFGSLSFEYVVNDGVLDSLPVRVQIQITAMNDAPIAASDVYNLPTGAPLVVIAAQGVLSNDVDPDSDTLLATVAQAPATGTLSLALNGGFLFTPAANTLGQVNFSYRARDPQGLEAIGTVTINSSVPVTDNIFKNGFEDVQ